MADAKVDPSTTPFEHALIDLHPTVLRMAQLSRVTQRTASEEDELQSLTRRVKNSPAAQRLAELTSSSPMTCVDFEQAVTNQWARAAAEVPALAAGIATLRQSCAGGALVLEGLWSGFASPDWHSRIVLGDEELPRSEETGKILAGFGGVVAIVAGVAIGVAVPGGQVIGAFLVSVGIGGVSYALTGKGYVGVQCEFDDDPEKCKSTNGSLTIGANGCLSGADACTTASQCPDTGSMCSYGCCEAFSSGLAEQMNGLSTYGVFLELPAGVLPNQVAVWASRSAKINDRAEVLNAVGNGAPVITTTQASSAALGVDTFVGKLISDGTATLRDRAHINGDLTVSGAVSYNNVNTVVVDGTTALGAAAASAQLPPTRLVWLTTFKDSGLSAVSLEPDQTLTLAPGDYGSVTVKPRAHLVLQPGQYHLNGLSMDATSFLDVPANLLTKLDIRNTLSMSGTVEQAGNAQTLMITFVGASAFVTGGFAGTLVAPYASLNLHVTDIQMRGSVWGMDVELYEGGEVRLANTSVWDLVTNDLGG
ncbi:MAG TPA: hypothetical protein VGM44_18500 [Polyangiaceae bacterium]